jgi:hypothetical protein
MKSIVAVHEDDMDVVVQPGVGWVELNEQLASRGVFFPVDPAPGARVGGMVCCYIFLFPVNFQLRSSKHLAGTNWEK